MENKKLEKESISDLRKRFALKLEEILGPEGSFKIYHKSGSRSLDMLAKNESLLIIANENFKEIFEKVDFDLVYESKGEGYNNLFKSAYEQCQAAVRSNANLSLNASAVGCISPSINPLRTSSQCSAYDDFEFLVEDLYNLDHDYFINLKDYNNKYETIQEVVRLIYDLEDVAEKEDESEDGHMGELIYSRNKILFGPPGTGKSFNIKSKRDLINVKEEHITRVTFHPEYSYYEFIGQYKPVVAYENTTSSIRYPNSPGTSNEKAFVYYDFVPGPFTKSIIRALKLRESSNRKLPENALLIIEEINRGNASAIFGDIFQLLDRINDLEKKEYGESEYSIDISIEMKEYIKKELKWEEEDWNRNFDRGFIIPSNLYIYATMNTSDQSLYPMDSAFKRRWDMEYIYINYKESKLKNLYLPEPYSDVKWLDFIRVINDNIVAYTEVDDKQIGQWFAGTSLSESEFIGKIVSYLWFDIFRYDPQLLFKDNIDSFDKVRTLYDKGIFSEEIKGKFLGKEDPEPSENSNEGY